jgi:hypothetical protein
MTPEQTPKRTRRSILVAAAGAAALSVTKALKAPGMARAAGDDGSNLQIAGTYADAQGQTTLGNRANNNRVLWVASNADLGNGNGVAVTGYSAKNVGVEGWSSNGHAIYGHSDGAGNGVRGVSASRAGVYGESAGLEQAGVQGRGLAGMGVYGQSSASGDPAVGGWHPTYTGVTGRSGDGEDIGARQKTGVYGHCETAGGSGIHGYVWDGRGVFGEATTGVGVYGLANQPAGMAFRGSGRVRLDKVSGVATIKAETTSVTITPNVKVVSGSFVLLTPKANLGTRALWFTTNPTGNSFTIRMSASRTKATKVAWLLLG